MEKIGAKMARKIATRIIRKRENASVNDVGSGVIRIRL